jgi:hypothetical protein
MANWFTMGAGIIVPDNDIDVTANSEGGFYKIDGKKYNADDLGTLTGSVEHRNKLAPYGTIGIRPNINNNWGVFGVVGAAYLGKTDATIRTTSTNPNVRLEGDAVIPTSGESAAQVAAKAQNELESKDWLEWMPIVKVGATYRF